MDSLRQDLHGSLRRFRRHRGFVGAAVLVLALGIGATTAVFSVSEALLLRPLPHPDGDRLVALQSVRRPGDFPFTRAAAGTLADWQRQATSFDAVAGYRWVSVDLIDGARSHRLSGLLATPEFFEVFGVPVTGRTFVAGDRGAGTVVLGRDAWRRLFDADESLVGGTIDLHVRDLSRVGPTRFTVLGVAAAPERFPPIEADFELGVGTVVDTVDFWLPMFVAPTDTREAVDRTIIGSLIGDAEWWMTVVGVAGDVRYGGLEAAPTDDVYLPQGLYPQAAITLVVRTAGDPMGAAAAVRARIRGVDEHAFVTDVRSMDEVVAASQAERRAGTLLIALFGTLALALVAAGVHGVITQAVVQRRQELAVRSALGAGPARVVALAMRTALQPAMIGIAIGALGAAGLTRVLSAVLFGVGAFDAATWVGAGLVILAACVAAGYLPARRASRIDPMTTLRAE